MVGLLVGVIVLAFTGPGTRAPGTGNPDFWIKSESGNDVYYNPAGGGNVGIGTTAPNYTLDVNGTINAATAVKVGGTALPQYSDTRFYVGGFTYDASITGTLAITGLGFAPKLVIFFADVDNTPRVSWGGDAYGVGRDMYDNYAGQGAGHYNSEGALSSIYMTEGTNKAYAKITSYDSDGFTITRYKTNSPTGTVDVQYIAFR